MHKKLTILALTCVVLGACSSAPREKDKTPVRYEQGGETVERKAWVSIINGHIQVTDNAQDAKHNSAVVREYSQEKHLAFCGHGQDKALSETILECWEWRL